MLTAKLKIELSATLLITEPNFRLNVAPLITELKVQLNGTEGQRKIAPSYQSRRSYTIGSCRTHVTCR